jgi:hypothetical protein
MREHKLITIEHKDLFNYYLKQMDNKLSDFTFTNLFIWQKKYSTYFEIIKDYLCVFVKTAEHPLIVMKPVGAGNSLEILDDLIVYFEQRDKPFVMKSLTYETAKMYMDAFPGCLKITNNIDNYDYVYLSEKLIHLDGKRLHAKRNHINKFIREYNYRYEVLDSSNIDDVYRFSEEWFNNNAFESDSLQNENIALFKALDNFSALDYSGGIIYVNDKVAAFSLGEQLNSDTAVIHIEKACNDIHGAYAIINQQFCKHNFSRFKYINREEDLGIERIRKAKKSYKPDHMIEKYSLSLQHGK